jgi:glutamate:GABA antiporter
MASSTQNMAVGEPTLPRSTKSTAQTSRFRRVLRGLDMALFTVCAILFLDQLTVSASMGVQSISLWLLTLVFFFIPYGLITAELGSTYTEEGGIYAWVRRAFGPVWAGRTAWLWWVSVAVWLPSVCILFAVIFSDVFAPKMGQWTKILMIFALIWLTVGINIVRLDLGKWVPNLGAAFKAIVILALGIGGIVYASSHDAATKFSTISELIPSLDNTLLFYPVIVYNFLGFELMSGAGEEMQNPARDVPFAIGRSGALIAFFYLFATVGMLLALPAEYFAGHFTEGLPDTFRTIFGTRGAGNALVIALCVLSLYTFVANMVTWSMGANRSAAEAANRGDLPSIFAKLHSTYRTPANSAVLCGLISTLVLVGFLYVDGFPKKDFNVLFWTTFAFSLVVFLLPYLLLFASFLKLRLADPNMARPYRVPGGYPTAVLLTIVCTLFILVAIVLLVFPVDPETAKIDTTQAKFIVFCVVATVFVGELLVRLAQRRQGALANV